MHFMILHVGFLFLADSKVSAKPVSQELVKSNIEAPLLQPRGGSTKAKTEPASHDHPRFPPSWCRPHYPPDPYGPPFNTRPIFPEMPSKDPPKPKNINPNRPKDKCPLPEYPILVTCPTDYHLRRGTSSWVTVGEYDYLVIKSLQQCSAGIRVHTIQTGLLPKLEQYCCKEFDERDEADYTAKFCYKIS